MVKQPSLEALAFSAAGLAPQVGASMLPVGSEPSLQEALHKALSGEVNHPACDMLVTSAHCPPNLITPIS